MIPDAEKVISEFLRDHVAVAALVGRRIVGKTPDKTSTPWVRLVELDAVNSPASPAEHLISYLLQADCYASKDGGQPEAKLIGYTVRAALHDDLPGMHDDVVVTSVRVSSRRMVDDDIEPARERVILTITAHMHGTA